MALQDIQSFLKRDAELLKDYQLMGKTELANGYCDADEAEAKARQDGDVAQEQAQCKLKSHYFSALMLRYWYKIFEWMNNSSSLLIEQEEYVDWLSESLLIAFRYRVWRYPYKMKFGKHSHEVEDYAYDENGEKIPNPYYYETDPCAPDRVFNRCIFSARGRAYQYANMQKRKDGVHRMSLDSMVKDAGDFATATANAFVVEEPLSPVAELIKAFVKKGEIIEAFIIDGIAYADAFKEPKKSTGEVTTNSMFDPRKLVKHLNNIDNAYIKDFCKVYGLDAKTLLDDKSDKTTFQKMNNNKIYKCIEKTLCEIKQTPELLGCLM